MIKRRYSEFYSRKKITESDGDSDASITIQWYPIVFSGVQYYSVIFSCKLVLCVYIKRVIDKIQSEINTRKIKRIF